MDDIDRQLLILIQREIPIHRRPFELIGQILGVHSADVILRLHHLRDEKLIRRIGPVFDTEKLGFRTAAVLFKIPSENLDQAGSFVSSHPGVVSCAGWKGPFNLWFTLALPPRESVELHVSRLKEWTGALEGFRVKTLQVYKGRGPEPLRNESGVEKVTGEFTALELELLKTLEEDFPLTDDPYQRIAKSVGTSEEFVIKQLLFFQKNGFLKKINADTLGFKPQVPQTHVMWEIPEEKIDFVAGEIAERREVKRCVKQSGCFELPFNLCAVLEGLDPSEIFSWIESVKQQIGPWPNQIYLHQREYKKIRPKYFTNEIEEWRMAHRAVLPLSN